MRLYRSIPHNYRPGLRFVVVRIPQVRLTTKPYRRWKAKAL